jgi:hypothetical protein
LQGRRTLPRVVLAAVALLARTQVWYHATAVPSHLWRHTPENTRMGAASSPADHHTHRGTGGARNAPGRAQSTPVHLCAAPCGQHTHMPPGCSCTCSAAPCHAWQTETSEAQAHAAEQLRLLAPMTDLSPRCKVPHCIRTLAWCDCQRSTAQRIRPQHSAAHGEEHECL